MHNLFYNLQQLGTHYSNDGDDWNLFQWIGIGFISGCHLENFKHCPFDNYKNIAELFNYFIPFTNSLAGCKYVN